MQNKHKTLSEKRLNRNCILFLVTVMLTTLVILSIADVTGVFPQVQHSTYMYTDYTVQQKELRNKLYKLTPDNLQLIYTTKMDEHAAATVITDFLLYDPYSYWIQPDYTLTLSDDTLYLNCKTDYTNAQRKDIDRKLKECIDNAVTDAKKQKENGIRAVYETLYRHITDITITDGTYRAPIRCCLIDRACNCQGLAYTFLYLCEQVGVQAELQYGNYYGEKCVGWTVDSNALKDGTYVIDRSNAGHVWNVVVLEHTPYYIDIYAQIEDAKKDLQFLSADEIKKAYYLWDETAAQQFQGTHQKPLSAIHIILIVVVLLVLLIGCFVVCIRTHSSKAKDTYSSIL